MAAHDGGRVADPLDLHLPESSTCGRMSLYKNDEPRAGILRAAARGMRERHRCTFGGCTICRGYFTAMRCVILKFSYPSFGMDPTTPPDVGRHGYLSFRGCTSVCWSPARARTERRRSPSPARGHWCNPRCPLCTCPPLSSRYPAHRLRSKLNLREKICFLTGRVRSIRRNAIVTFLLRS